MKRVNHIFEKIIDIDNLREAERKARKRKQKTVGVRWFDRDAKRLLLELQQTLMRGEYKTSKYHIFKIYEPKERVIYRLPYYPDRIVHHAILNVLEPIYMQKFTADTFSCIKRRGIHACARSVKRMLRNDREGTRYCLKLDIRKYYPNIDHEILKAMHRRIIKDVRVLTLIDEIIDSVGGTKGVPIGNYLSQYFANFYLTPFDHWIKENRHIKHYARYADDIVVFGSTKEELHKILGDIRDYFATLKLEIKGNYQIYPTDVRGVDFVGYVFRHDYTLLRKCIKQRFAKRIKSLNRLGRHISEKAYRTDVAPWWGWLKYADCIHLLRVLSVGAVYKIEFKY